MRHQRFGLLLSTAAAVVLISGCDSGGEPGDSAAGTPAAPVPTEVASTAPTPDEATVKACEALLTSIESNVQKIAEAEKIGPPSGHDAVGAAYAAGAADIELGKFGASPLVTDAAAQVGVEMDALKDAWAKNPAKKPSKSKLNAAVTELETACGQD
ncbi:hypothetical protein [Actinoplanes sp. G11-F43]|uniref:hypothetical protein n=1 Tax=Actinoplanes sp. G11-F43 TaxID=3424130 RepID=UPI003D325AD5